MVHRTEKGSASALARLLRDCPDGLRLSEHLEGSDDATVFKHVCAMGLEGIVATRQDRPYRSGRCADWIKIKPGRAGGDSRD
jgi:bifunctional non-homologous end joining protein LigD